MVTSFVENCSRMERRESAEHLLDDPDLHCYKKPLEVAPPSKEYFCLLIDVCAVTLFHHVTCICSFNS